MRVGGGCSTFGSKWSWCMVFDRDRWSFTSSVAVVVDANTMADADALEYTEIDAMVDLGAATGT